MFYQFGLILFYLYLRKYVSCTLLPLNDERLDVYDISLVVSVHR